MRDTASSLHQLQLPLPPVLEVLHLPTRNTTPEVPLASTADHRPVGMGLNKLTKASMPFWGTSESLM